MQIICMQKESVKILKFKKNLGKYHDLYLKVMDYFWLGFSKTSEKYAS